MALQTICFARTRESPFIVESISRKPYEKRLARLLLLLANFGKDDKPEPIIAKQQETFAEMIGTTRSRVSFS
jgi:hypothetical protein